MTTVIECRPRLVEKQTLDLQSLVQVLGPRFAEGEDERDAADTFVAGHYDVLKQHKVFSALVPADLGGGGVRHSSMAAFLRELAHYSPSTALSLSMHQHLVAAAVYNHRQGRPGKKLLERVAANETVLISTGASDWMESNGTVTRADGGFRVSAKKPFGSGSPKGDVLVTSAPFEDPKEDWQVLHFTVPFTAQGVSLADDWRTLGMRATGSQTIILDNVFVPDDAISLKRPRGRFHPAWNVILTAAMPLIMSVYTGVAEAAAVIGHEQAQKRQGDPTVPYLLGELTNQLTAAQLAVDDMVRLANDLNFAMDVKVANAILIRKTIAAEHVIATVEKALEAAGGGGFYRKTGLERFLRDAHAAQFHPLSAKKQHRFTGRLALGLDPIAEATEPLSRPENQKKFPRPSMITRVFHTRVPMSQWDVGGGHRLGGRLRASINASTPFNPKLRHPLTAEIVDMKVIGHSNRTHPVKAALRIWK